MTEFFDVQDALKQMPPEARGVIAMALEAIDTELEDGKFGIDNPNELQDQVQDLSRQLQRVHEAENPESPKLPGWDVIEPYARWVLVTEDERDELVTALQRQCHEKHGPVDILDQLESLEFEDVSLEDTDDE